MSQRELAERAGVPVTMISAYERDQRQPTLSTLLRLLRAAGFDLRLHLAAYDPHDDILAGLEAWPLRIRAVGPRQAASGMAPGIACRGCGVSEHEAAGEPELGAAAIVAALNRHQVRYIIIGAFAAIAQQAPRYQRQETST